jgi:hypothetical protein
MFPGQPDSGEFSAVKGDCYPELPPMERNPEARHHPSNIIKNQEAMSFITSMRTKPHHLYSSKWVSKNPYKAKEAISQIAADYMSC